MDFVDDILLPGEEKGIRVDTNYIYAPTACVVNSITENNLNYILTAIRTCQAFMS